MSPREVAGLHQQRAELLLDRITFIDRQELDLVQCLLAKPEPQRRFGRDLARKCPCGLDERVCGNYLLNETDAPCLPGIDRLPGEKHPAQKALRYMPPHMSCAATTPYIDFRHAEGRPLGSEPDVADRREYGSGAKRGAVDGRDRRKGAIADGSEASANNACPDRILLDGRGKELLEIEPRAKARVPAAVKSTQ